MRGPERLRFGPSFKGGAAFPDSVRSIEGVIFCFGTFEKVKLYKARHLVEMAVTRKPDLLERCLGPLGDTDSLAGAAQEKGAQNICTFIRQSCFFVCNPLSRPRRRQLDILQPNQALKVCLGLR